ncbi:hypothetical protein ACFWF7_38695 [Nocardia sp. NPDC060256]|uniref:hypothetical protein n=1 Tax=unclassified Nocardia TaxID=2637762 RepID=UPI00364D5D49
MEREHEDAMRTDFAERVRLNEELFHAENLGSWDSDSDEQARRRDEINSRWSAGPHAEQWAYLNKAHHSWEWDPKLTRDYMDWLDHYRRLGHEMVDDIQRRSLEQTQELSGNTFQVGYERNAPDVARFTADTPVPVFGTARQRLGIERGR